VIERLVVKPGSPAGLAGRDPADRLGLVGKDAATVLLGGLIEELGTLHNRLWAEARRSLLLVLQGVDASGKDGAIRSVFTGVNPQGCRVTSFKVPTATEQSHDYLWRLHAVCPARGEIGIWNRSHYEDIVAVRVRKLAPKKVWKPRARHIREFERLLTDEGTKIVKVFLHISNEEQRRQLQERIDDPEKRWKFREGDLDDRALWVDFMAAYEDALTETSSSWAPWYIVPADHKWVRNVAVARLLVEALRRMDPQLPRPDGLEGLTVP
jgi:PPK2 family polyphosphate:nucleotide phosphotransferase